MYTNIKICLIIQATFSVNVNFSGASKIAANAKAAARSFRNGEIHVNVTSFLPRDGRISCWPS